MISTIPEAPAPLPCEAEYTPALERRYRRLAGAFRPPEACLLIAMRDYLRATGARIVLVAEPDGVCVWRLASECETLLETEDRLRRMTAAKTED